MANYGTGDGLEKAFLLANVICHRQSEQDVEITVKGSDVMLKAQREYRFTSQKGLKKQISIPLKD